MKNTSQSLIIFSVCALLFLEAAPGVSAFQAVLLPDQSLIVTHGEVLGKEDDVLKSFRSGSNSSTNTSPQNEMTPDAHKRFEADYIKSNNITTEQVKARDESLEAERTKTAKTKASPAISRQSVQYKRIKLNVEGNKGKLEVLERTQSATGSVQRLEPKNSEPETDGQKYEDRFMKLELVNAANRPQATSAAGVPRRIEDNNAGPGVQESQVDRNITIQTPPFQDSPTQLEIKSRDTRSFIQPGSSVTVDPKTNDISVSDKKGQDRPLLRLPDQAFQELTNQGAVFPDRYDEAKENLTILTKDDGSVVYRTEVTNQRRLFGFIPYAVKVSHEVNDQTGEVTTQDVQDSSFFSRFRKLLGQ